MSLLGGLFGYAGTRHTNQSNEKIASARNAFEREEAVKAREFSAQESSLNRDFQERMSNTQVQRRYKDMKEAGINPLLAGKFEASSPSGSVGATAKANAHGYEHKNEFEGFMSSALNVLQLKKQAAEIDNIEAQTRFTRNKSEISDPLSEIMGVLGRFLQQPASTAKSFAPKSTDWVSRNVVQKGIEAIQSAKSGVANRVSNTAKKVTKVKQGVESWWNQLRDDVNGIAAASRRGFTKAKAFFEKKKGSKNRSNNAKRRSNR